MAEEALGRASSGSEVIIEASLHVVSGGPVEPDAPLAKYFNTELYRKVKVAANAQFGYAQWVSVSSTS
jgi:transcriptional regulator of met regulon